MSEVSEHDIVATIGSPDELILREMLRTRASVVEFRQAVAIVSSRADANRAADHAPRVQRLVDLLSVAIEPCPNVRRNDLTTTPRGGRSRAA